MLGLRCCAALCLVAASGGYSLVVVLHLLTVVVSLVDGAQALGHVDFSGFSSWALEPRLSSHGVWAHLL